MEKSDTVHEHFVSDGSPWPSNIKSCDETAKELGIPSDRLRELAEGGYAPHWRIDGGPPMFSIRETKQWAARNILEKTQGKTLPVVFKILTQPPVAKKPPAAICHIKNIRQVPYYEMPPGVYFLAQDDKIVYVGKSTSVMARIAAHDKDTGKQFNRVYMVQAPESELDTLEREFIRTLDPELNRVKYITGNTAGLTQDNTVLT